MAGRTLTFDITTQDAQTIAALRRVQKELGKTGDTAHTAGVRGAEGQKLLKNALLGVGLAAGAKAALGQTEEAQQVAARTAAVIKSTGNAAHVSAKQQDDYAQALSKTAAVDDEVINGGANLLRAFQNIKGENFGRTLGDTLDYAAAKGIDFDTAIGTIGKALNDPIKGMVQLRRVGIQLSAQQQQQVKDFVAAGDVAGAQGVILGQLEKSYGGSAKAMATDSAKTKVALQNTEEAVGKALRPAVEVVGELATSFSDLPDSVQTGVAAVVLGAVGIAKAKSAVDSFRRSTDAAKVGAVALGKAEEGVAAESAGMTTALGPLGIALATVTAAYLAWQSSKDDRKATFDAQELIGGTNKQLAETAALYARLGKEADLEQLGRQSLPALKALREAAKDAGLSTKDYDTAIHHLASEHERATKREGEFGDAAETTGSKVEATAAKVEHFGEALQGVKIQKAASDLFDMQTAASEAGAALGQSYTDLATAQQAAIGNSDEYRAAKQQEIDDSQAVVDAQKDERDAVTDLSKAREDAKKRLDDYRDSVIKTAMSERDARLQVMESEAELRKVIADPRSSALDKAKAQVALADANDQATLAQHEHNQAVQENAQAQAAGIEGDQAVIDAKSKVVDAQDRVRESQAKVAEDAKAKNKIIADAVLAVKAAQDKVNESLLTQIKTNSDLVAAQLGPLAGQKAYADGLQGIYDSLDPKSPLAQRVGQFLAAINDAIALQTHVAASPVPGPTSRVPEGNGNQPTLPARATKGLGGGVNLTIVTQGTPTQTRRTFERTAARHLDRMVGGTR